MTVEELFVNARGKLGDVDEPGGGVFTDDKIRQFYQEAYRTLFNSMRLAGIAAIQKTVYYNLPELTSALIPAQMGVTDMGEPVSVWERGGLTTAAVTAATGTSPITLTITSHPFAEADELIVSQTGPASNGRWFINLNSGDPANKVDLRGSYATAAWSGTGKASKSTEKFKKLGAPSRLGQWDPTDTLQEYVWEEGVFRFVGATVERQLKIEYKASGVPPYTGEIGVDGAEDFLISFAGGQAGSSFGKPKLGNELMAVAGVHLNTFLGNKVKELQRISWRPKSRLAGRRGSYR